MGRSTLRRTGAILWTAALLASLTAATAAAPVSAAKPKCQGLPATIVGTAKGEIVRGTARRDIIVAKGGNDRIYGKGGNDIICAGGGNDIVYGGPGADRLWGQLGHDKLNGNAGPDFLAGQVGNDPLNGGTGVDTCFQGTGTGPVVACERPAPPSPPPPAPSLIPLTGILAVAYSDVDGLDGYSTGDVLIAKLVDNGNGQPGAGDTVEMGRYPANFDATAFGDWYDKSHAVTSGGGNATGLWVYSDGGYHEWYRGTDRETFNDDSGASDPTIGYSQFSDGLMSPHQDNSFVGSQAPSIPTAPSSSIAWAARYSDDQFIDVALNWVPQPARGYTEQVLTLDSVGDQVISFYGDWSHVCPAEDSIGVRLVQAGDGGVSIGKDCESFDDVLNLSGTFPGIDELTWESSGTMGPSVWTVTCTHK